MNELPDLFKDIELDNDIKEKKKVYLIIAKFIQEKLNEPIPVSLGATHILCQEEDKDLLEDGADSSRVQQLANKVKAIILKITILYEPQTSKSYTRKTEIYFINNNQPAIFRNEEELAWDELPEPIRAEFLKTGSNSVSRPWLFPWQ